MKKFLAGVFVAIGAFILGKGVYQKGYNDGVERIEDNFELIKTGMGYNELDDKPSKQQTKKETK